MVTTLFTLVLIIVNKVDTLLYLIDLLITFSICFILYIIEIADEKHLIFRLVCRFGSDAHKPGKFSLFMFIHGKAFKK